MNHFKLCSKNHNRMQQTERSVVQLPTANFGGKGEGPLAMGTTCACTALYQWPTEVFGPQALRRHCSVGLAAYSQDL